MAADADLKVCVCVFRFLLYQFYSPFLVQGRRLYVNSQSIFLLFYPSICLFVFLFVCLWALCFFRTSAHLFKPSTVTNIEHAMTLKEYQLVPRKSITNALITMRAHPGWSAPWLFACNKGKFLTSRPTI